MSYKVIHYFTDLQDFNHAYNVGDEFPRQGMKVSESRLLELSTENNRQGKPLIKLETKEVVVDIPQINYTKTEINRMSTSDLQALANELGFSNADEMTGGELKKVLIEKYNL